MSLFETLSEKFLNKKAIEDYFDENIAPRLKPQNKPINIFETVKNIKKSNFSESVDVKSILNKAKNKKDSFNNLLLDLAETHLSIKGMTTNINSLSSKLNELDIPLGNIGRSVAGKILKDKEKYVEETLVKNARTLGFFYPILNILENIFEKVIVKNAKKFVEDNDNLKNGRGLKEVLDRLKSGEGFDLASLVENLNNGELKNQTSDYLQEITRAAFNWFVYKAARGIAGLPDDEFDYKIDLSKVEDTVGRSFGKKLKDRKFGINYKTNRNIYKAQKELAQEVMRNYKRGSLDEKTATLILGRDVKEVEKIMWIYECFDFDDLMKLYKSLKPENTSSKKKHLSSFISESKKGSKKFYTIVLYLMNETTGENKEIYKYTEINESGWDIKDIKKANLESYLNKEADYTYIQCVRELKLFKISNESNIPGSDEFNQLVKLIKDNKNYSILLNKLNITEFNIGSTGATLNIWINNKSKQILYDEPKNPEEEEERQIKEFIDSNSAKQKFSPKIRKIAYEAYLAARDNAPYESIESINNVNGTELKNEHDKVMKDAFKSATITAGLSMVTAVAAGAMSALSGVAKVALKGKFGKLVKGIGKFIKIKPNGGGSGSKLMSVLKDLSEKNYGKFMMAIGKKFGQSAVSAALTQIPELAVHAAVIDNIENTFEDMIQEFPIEDDDKKTKLKELSSNYFNMVLKKVRLADIESFGTRLLGEFNPAQILYQNKIQKLQRLTGVIMALTNIPRIPYFDETNSKQFTFRDILRGLKSEFNLTDDFINIFPNYKLTNQGLNSFIWIATILANVNKVSREQDKFISSAFNDLLPIEHSNAVSKLTSAFGFGTDPSAVANREDLKIFLKEFLSIAMGKENLEEEKDNKIGLDKSDLKDVFLMMKKLKFNMDDSDFEPEIVDEISQKITTIEPSLIYANLIEETSQDLPGTQASDLVFLMHRCFEVNDKLKILSANIEIIDDELEDRSINKIIEFRSIKSLSYAYWQYYTKANYMEISDSSFTKLCYMIYLLCDPTCTLREFDLIKNGIINKKFLNFVYLVFGLVNRNNRICVIENPNKPLPEIDRAKKAEIIIQAIYEIYTKNVDKSEEDIKLSLDINKDIKMQPFEIHNETEVINKADIYDYNNGLKKLENMKLREEVKKDLGVGLVISNEMNKYELTNLLLNNSNKNIYEFLKKLYDSVITSLRFKLDPINNKNGEIITDNISLEKFGGEYFKDVDLNNNTYDQEMLNKTNNFIKNTILKNILELLENYFNPLLNFFKDIWVDYTMNNIDISKTIYIWVLYNNIINIFINLNAFAISPKTYLNEISDRLKNLIIICFNNVSTGKYQILLDECLKECKNYNIPIDNYKKDYNINNIKSVYFKLLGSIDELYYILLNLYYKSLDLVLIQLNKHFKDNDTIKEDFRKKISKIKIQYSSIINEQISFNSWNKDKSVNFRQKYLNAYIDIYSLYVSIVIMLALHTNEKFKKAAIKAAGDIVGTAAGVVIGGVVSGGTLSAVEIITGVVSLAADVAQTLTESMSTEHVNVINNINNAIKNDLIFENQYENDIIE